MLSKSVKVLPLGRILFSLLLVSSFKPFLCQLSSSEPQPRQSGMDTDKEVGDFQDSLFNYAFHSPGHIDSPAERLEELRAFMAEKNLQMPKRYSSFVRVGRRGGGGKFVRIGKKNGLDEEGDQNTDAFQYYVPESIGFPGKRQMHRFIRIGRGMEGNDHGDGMLAEGGSLGDLDVNSFARYRKAPSSFVRIGKAPNKFLRIGKISLKFCAYRKSPKQFCSHREIPD